MKFNKLIGYIGTAVLTVPTLFSLTGCGDDFLKPDPLSFYEPSKTFTTREGLESALATCDKHIRNVAFHWQGGETPPLMSDYYLSEIGVNGTTDQPSVASVSIDFNVYLTPTAKADNSTMKWNYVWSENFSGVKYANSIITNIDKVEGLDSGLKDEMLGRAYFHRAIKYFNLVFQFKDTPLFTQEVQGPKFDYRSTKRSVILDMITKDLEFAVAHVPATTEYGGMVTKGTCRQLLIKCYLATGQFDKAINEANILIDQSGYQLMQESFGTFVNPMPDVHPVQRNIIWDLHRPENKMDKANKEVIYCMVNRYGIESTNVALQTMRSLTPFWSGTNAEGIKTPDGQIGMDITTTYFNYKKTYGRGVARMRPTNYYQYSVWLDDPTDLRHDVASGNWMVMENLKYNNPNLYKNNNAFAGKNLRLYADDGKTLLCSDTIRNWFGWPQYKTWVEDPDNESKTTYNGGPADWYMYRLAETYLLRAEAYIWKGDKANAAADVNEIRKRAHCTKLFKPEEMDMGVVMDERARELYMEEWRHVELGRVSYIFALTGQTDEFGQTYTEETISDNSYWWQRIKKYNNFYNSGMRTRSNVEYTLSPYHIFLPVPQASIDGNREGVINQNKGYAGYEHNIEPFDNLEDAIKSELTYSN